MSKTRDKTIKGIFWSFMDNGINQIAQFIVGIILARMLSPKEFGLIGMITVFVLISEAFINSGFSQALIRKRNCDQTDFSTAFFFNLFASSALYTLLFLTAPQIANFYKQPELIQLVRILGIILFINAFGIVQQAILIKAVDFKTQAKISFISSIISGLVAIIAAFYGLGVWSLVLKMLLRSFVNTVVLWLGNRWYPKSMFSKNSFKELFSFGNKLLLSGLLKSSLDNIYYIVIGKFFSVNELGFFSRADQFTKLPSHTLTKTLQRVAFPVLSEMQDDDIRLKTAYKKFIKITVYINSSVMLILAAVAEPLIVSLLGVKWIQTVPYLQLLCLSQLVYPAISLNMNTLIVKGRTDLFLKLEILSKLLIIPVVIIGIFTNIYVMIIGIIIQSVLQFLIISFSTSKMINYRVVEQLLDVGSGFVIAFLSALFLKLLQQYIFLEPLTELLTLTSIGGFLIILFSEILRNNSYIELKSIVQNKFLKYRQ